MSGSGYNEQVTQKYLMVFLLLINLSLFSINISTTSFELPNGLRVILSHDDTAQSACIMSYHLTGVRDDRPEFRGASYLYQDFSRLGTENLDPFDRFVQLQKMGGQSGERVSYDYSIFFQLVPEGDVDRAIWMESERLKTLKLDDATIQVFKDSLYNRFNSMVDNNVDFRSHAWVTAKVFEGTPYHFPVYGQVEKIRLYNNLYIKSVYQRFQDLSNMILIVSGRFDMDEVKSLINRYFQYSGFKKSAQQKTFRSLNPRTEKVYENWLIENFPTNFAIYGFRGPGKENLDYIYFDFIRYYLADPRISKLYRIFNRSNDLNISIDQQLDGYFETSVFTIRLEAEKRVNLETAKVMLNKELSNLSLNLISSQEIKITRNLMEIDFLKRLSDLVQKSELIGENYYLLGDSEQIENYQLRIQRISSYDIISIAKKYLQASNWVILNVYPKN